MSRAMRTLIVAARADRRQLLRTETLLLPGVEVIATVSNCELAAERVRASDVDLVILEVDEASPSVATSMKELADARTGIQVAVVHWSSGDEEPVVVDALSAGALDVIVLPGGKLDTYRRRLSRLLNTVAIRSTVARVEKHLTEDLPGSKRGTGDVARGAGTNDLTVAIPTRDLPGRRTNTDDLATAKTRDLHAPPRRARSAHAEGRARGTRDLRSVELHGHGTANRAHRHSIAPRAGVTERVDAIAIGISTGGPDALTRVVPFLPADLAVPVFIVQHMPPNFTAALAASLDKTSALRVVEAKDGDAVEPGTVYIAPGGLHMTVRGNARVARSIRCEDGPLVQQVRPSVDVLLASMADAYLPSRTVVAIMTGMGADGRDGCRVLKSLGAFVLIQDEETSAVWGMPRAVFDAGLFDEVLPLHEIAERLVALTRLGGHA